MNILTKTDFENLADIKYSTCVSFYLPTHQRGMEVVEEHDQILFKNQLKEVKEELLKRGWGERNVEDFLLPVNELLRHPTFWRNQSESVAIFLTNNFLEFYNLPFIVEPSHYIFREFYLRPLVPALSGDGKFFVLGLNLHQITFYEGNRDRLKEISVEDLTPQRMEEVVGYDYKDKFLQFRSQQEGHGAAAFHGHGEWKGKFRKDEILRFFREVDKKISTLLKGKKTPLVIMGQEYFFPIYKKANTYPYLISEHLDLNPQQLNLEDLHEKIWTKLYIRFDKERVNKVEMIHQLHDSEQVSFNLQQIISAAATGRVDTLFVRKNGEVFGVFDKSENKVIMEDEQTSTNVSLINLAIVEVIKNGGKVYEQIAETMPMPYVKLNALYRY